MIRWHATEESAIIVAVNDEAPSLTIRAPTGGNGAMNVSASHMGAGRQEARKLKQGT